MKSTNIYIDPGSSYKSRIQWVDVMRGFSMILVVLGHVLMTMNLGGYHSVLSSILLTFRMPLFFFVSGFFSYRAIEWWTKSRMTNIIKRKFQAQIFCTFVFLGVLSFCQTGKYDLLSGFGGYWFTIVLFQMYILYILFSLFSMAIKTDIAIPVMIIISISFVIILAFYRPHGWAWEYFCWENLTKYTQFFTLGLICSRQRKIFFDIMTKNWFATLMIVSWMACMLLWYNTTFEEFCPFSYSIVHDMAVRYFSLMTVVMLFFRHAQTFSDDSAASSLFRFIGRRTLDIYMIHYFFLPDLSFLGVILSDGNLLIIQLLLSTIITAIIISLCLLISNILRQSKTLEHWLFGTR